MFQFVLYVEICVKMNCIILNLFPIMCFKGAPVLATYFCLNGTNYLVLFSHVLPVRIRNISLCLTVCPFERRGETDMS